MKVKGTFRQRSYQKDGATKAVRDFVLQNLAFERQKIRQQAG